MCFVMITLSFLGAKIGKILSLTKFDFEGYLIELDWPSYA